MEKKFCLRGRNETLKYGVSLNIVLSAANYVRLNFFPVMHYNGQTPTKDIPARNNRKQNRSRNHNILSVLTAEVVVWTPTPGGCPFTFF